MKPWALLGLFSSLALSCGSPSAPASTQRGAGPASLASPPAATVPPALRTAILAARQREGGSAYAYVSMDSTDRQGGGGLRADNPQQRFGIELDSAGVRLVHDEGAISLRLASWGCPDAMREVGPRRPAVAAGSWPSPPARRAEYALPASGAPLLEWYENGPLGLEQGFTIGAPPACSGSGGTELRLAVSMQGAKSLKQAPARSGEGTRVELTLGAGPQRLVYAGLDAYDAAGKRLPSQLRVDGQQAILAVDARAAKYPVTVDPVIWNDEDMLIAADSQAQDQLGYSVSISGDRAVVGANLSSRGGGTYVGAAYVFARSGTGWAQEAKLTASDMADNDTFGSSVSISGDTVVVGSPYASAGGISESGAAYVFVRSGTSWTQQAKLVASDKAVGDLLGSSVAISGDTVVAGAPYAGKMGALLYGAAYVFVRSGTSWTQQAELLASDKADEDFFGRSVAIDSDTAVVGAFGATRGGLHSIGAAYVFVRSGTSWTQQAELVASDKAEYDHFGWSVAIAGDTLAAGAVRDESGARLSGSAYVFVRSGTSWTQQAELSASDKSGGDMFGAAVALSLDTLLVGSNANKAYVLARSGVMWTEQAKLSGGTNDTYFGYAVAVSGAQGILGSYGTTLGTAASAGAAYVIHNGKANGDSCMGDSECASYHCVAGTCGAGNGDPCTLAQECKSGFCTDGVCCQTACAGGATDCQACSKAAGAAMDGTCGVVATGMVCQTADATKCLADATCDGVATTCKLKPAASTVVCSSVGKPMTCIANYKCDGSTIGSCPTGNPTPADTLTVCSATADPTRCIAGYRCNGVTTGSCPTSNPAPADSSTLCNATGDDSKCVASYLCDGMSAGTCPTTHPTPAKSTTVCDPLGDASKCVARYLCDGMSAGACPTTHPTAAGSSTVCSALGDASKCIGGYQCDGATTGSCPMTRPRPADRSTVCSASGDLSKCAANFKCDGVALGSCPTDNPTPVAAGVVCRPAASDCDAAEQCDGTGVPCPPDISKPDNTSCSAGSCQAGQCRLESDLSVQLSGMPNPTTQQQPIQVQVHVNNAGPSPAAQIVLTLDLPTDPGFAANHIEGDGWACQSADASVRCMRSVLASGAAPDVTLQAVPPIGQSVFTIKGTIETATFDPNSQNNSYQLGVTNVAPCSTACGGDGSDGQPASSGCQLGGRAPAPPAGWALVGLTLAAWWLRARRTPVVKSNTCPRFIRARSAAA